MMQPRWAGTRTTVTISARPGSGNCGSGFWDIDPDVCIMTCSQSCNRCGVNGMCQFEQACLRRVNDVFSQYP